jgi:glucose/arabinose dehydrogenase
MPVLPRITLAAAVGLIAALAASSPAAAAVVSLARVGTYDTPTYVGSIPTDGNRLLVGEKAGRIVETTGGTTTTYLDIRSRVAAPVGSEEGLLSFAFPSDYATSHLIYVAYTGNDAGALHVDEFRASDGAADPASRRPVITIPHPGATNHNGGQLQFGPDGCLYVSTGDGGGAGDPSGNAQSTSVLLGKILRIDPRPSGTQAYTVPAGNPFVGVAGARPEIWSYGLRNPWRFSFDRRTGALVVGDVGQNVYEEVDYAQQPSAGRGEDFGWNCREGFHPFGGGCGGSFTEPVFEYPHTGGRCAIIGGYVMRDPGIPSLLGRYVYTDLCVGRLRSLVLGLPTASGDRDEGVTVPTPTSFGEDACGRVYLAAFDGGVYRLTGPSSTPCGALLATATQARCSPARVTAPKPTRCTVTVSDAAGSEPPSGSVRLSSSDHSGSFGPGDCRLAPSGAGAARCSLRYRPGHQVGRVEITASYGGSSVHLPSADRTRIAVEASNAFKLGKPRLHPRRGTATLPVTVPRSGTVAVHGRHLKRAKRVARGRGRVKLAVEPAGRLARRLARAGAARVAAKVTYEPNGGDPRTKRKRIRLRDRS